MSFPDNGAATGFAGLVEHFRLLGEMDPVEIAELLESEEGKALVGSVEISGIEPVSLRQKWGRVVAAVPGRLSDEQYARFLQGEAPEPIHDMTSMKSEVVVRFEHAIAQSVRSHAHHDEE
jgi:hypothetical protein